MVRSCSSTDQQWCTEQSRYGISRGLASLHVPTMFDDSLRNLLNLSEAYRSQHAMALLRWEERNRLIPRSDQQDSWIFFPPLSNFTYIESETNFHLGALRCDNRFAEILSCAGYSVVNPCLAIRTHHVHSDNKTRTYRTRDQVRGKGRYVLLSDL